MEIMRLSPGENPPDDVFVLVESSRESRNVYRYDYKIDALFLDKVLGRHVPVCYGSIVHTHHDDGAPLDAVVLTTENIIPGTIVQARPVGFIRLEHKSVLDDVVITVPLSDPEFEDIRDIEDVPKRDIKDITEFLELLKGFKAKGSFGMQHTKKLIMRAIERHKKDEI